MTSQPEKAYIHSHKNPSSLLSRIKERLVWYFADPETTVRERLLIAFLVVFSGVFTVLVFGPLDILSANSAELVFRVGDIIWTVLAFALFAAVALIGVSMLFSRKAFWIWTGFLFSLGVIGYLEGNFIDVNMRSLVTDEVGINDASRNVWANLILWAILMAAVLFGVLFVKNKKIVKRALIIGCLLIIGMQAATLAFTIIPRIVKTYDNKSAYAAPAGRADDGITPAVKSDSTAAPSDGQAASDGKESSKNSYILTTKNLYTLAPEGNVIVIILDRFDASYFADLRKNNPEYLGILDGFTSYNDYITQYSRTYPAVTSIISGVNNDFSGSAADYFNKAYGSSKFLDRLQENNYDINLYTSSFYAYRSGRSLVGRADNMSLTDGYYLTNKTMTMFNLNLVSIYRYAPKLIKNLVKVSSSSFDRYVAYRTNDDTDMYLLNDYNFYANLLDNGLTVDVERTGNFTFIHLQGTHPVWTVGIDKDGNIAKKAKSAEEALRAELIILGEYFNALRAAGLYNDATIVITGDHANSVSDIRDLESPRLTAMLMKRSGESGTRLADSGVQVSQKNLIPSLLASAGLPYEDLGIPFWEVGSGNQTREYHFEKTMVGKPDDVIVVYEIMGDGHDFSNWTKKEEKPIGSLYK